ncbi:hypothetical protein OE88DRAFT_1368449 [Heliocybe sulcata]|uniref:Uncharacterized protein n=1 Tax=Heliocybe sulcata TaxID=5364 RepID=A0A5C3N577_9AGAM|nr:hypothetical protein OE88DRAFT_1368449 [Heliocybe sulcata]
MLSSIKSMARYGSAGWNAVSANYTTVRSISMPGVMHPGSKQQLLDAFDKHFSDEMIIKAYQTSVSNRLTIWAYPENAACGIEYGGSGHDESYITWNASDTIEYEWREDIIKKLMDIAQRIKKLTGEDAVIAFTTTYEVKDESGKAKYGKDVLERTGKLLTNSCIAVDKESAVIVDKTSAAESDKMRPYVIEAAKDAQGNPIPDGEMGEIRYLEFPRETEGVKFLAVRICKNVASVPIAGHLATQPPDAVVTLVPAAGAPEKESWWPDRTGTGWVFLSDGLVSDASGAYEVVTTGYEKTAYLKPSPPAATWNKWFGQMMVRGISWFLSIPPGRQDIIYRDAPVFKVTSHTQENQRISANGVEVVVSKEVQVVPKLTDNVLSDWAAVTAKEADTFDPEGKIGKMKHEDLYKTHPKGGREK